MLTWTWSITTRGPTAPPVSSGRDGAVSVVVTCPPEYDVPTVAGAPAGVPEGAAETEPGSSTVARPRCGATGCRRRRGVSGAASGRCSARGDAASDGPPVTLAPGTRGSAEDGSAGRAATPADLGSAPRGSADRRRTGGAGAAGMPGRFCGAAASPIRSWSRRATCRLTSAGSAPSARSSRRLCAPAGVRRSAASRTPATPRTASRMALTSKPSGRSAAGQARPRGADGWRCGRVRGSRQVAPRLAAPARRARPARRGRAAATPPMRTPAPGRRRPAGPARARTGGPRRGALVGAGPDGVRSRRSNPLVAASAAGCGPPGGLGAGSALSGRSRNGRVTRSGVSSARAAAAAVSGAYASGGAPAGAGTDPPDAQAGRSVGAGGSASGPVSRSAGADGRSYAGRGTGAVWATS